MLGFRSSVFQPRLEDVSTRGTEKFPGCEAHGSSLPTGKTSGQSSPGPTARSLVFIWDNRVFTSHVRCAFEKIPAGWVGTWDLLPSKAGVTPVPRIPGTHVPRIPSVCVPNIPSVCVPRIPSGPVPRILGIRVPRIPGIHVPRIPVVLVPKFPVVLVPRIPGVRVPRIPGIRVLRISGVRVPRIPGIRVPRIPGVPPALRRCGSRERSGTAQPLAQRGWPLPLSRWVPHSRFPVEFPSSN